MLDKLISPARQVEQKNDLKRLMSQAPARLPSAVLAVDFYADNMTDAREKIAAAITDLEPPQTKEIGVAFTIEAGKTHVWLEFYGEECEPIGPPLIDRVAEKEQELMFPGTTNLPDKRN